MMHPPSLHSALPQSIYQKRSTYIDFAENQLSPSLISLSPLSSNHPSILQHTRVRSFTLFYNKYSNLFKLRSLGFGFANDDQTALSYTVYLRLRNLLKLAITVKSLTHYTKGMPLHFHALTAVVFDVSFPFLHSTCSLSVKKIFIGFEGGSPIFTHDKPVMS